MKILNNYKKINFYKTIFIYFFTFFISFICFNLVVTSSFAANKKQNKPKASTENKVSTDKKISTDKKTSTEKKISTDKKDTNAKSNSEYLSLNEIEEQADKSLDEKKYSKAINLYKLYLQKNSEYSVWLKLAMAYYYYGFPKKCLEILQNHTPTSEAKRAHNLYYQGLCFLVLKQEENAKKVLTEAAIHLDKYGYEAIFEMCYLSYVERNPEHVNYWANIYYNRNPKGKRTARIKEMQNLANANSFSKPIQGATLPNIEKSFYRYHKYSLSKNPHFWLVQLGGNMDTTTIKSPKQNGVIVDSSSQTFGLLATAGIGLGPIETNSTYSLIGYNYKQNWITTNDRFSEWSSNMSGISSFFDTFPFRLDLMERTHQIYGDVAYKFNNYVAMGLYALLEIVRIGSSLGDDDIQSSASTLSEKILLTPWIGLEYMHNVGTKFYLYLNKKYDEDFPEKSFSMFSFENNFPISLLLTNYVKFSKIDLNINLDAFYFDYTFNDPWFDKNRIGGSLKVDYTFNIGLGLSLLGGYFVDLYKTKFLLDSSIQASASSQTVSDSQFEARKDSGFMIQGKAYYLLGEFHRFDLLGTYIQSSNPNYSIFNKQRYYITFMFTMGFPNSVRSIELMNKFDESNLITSDVK